jgi:hypothetical protein
VAGMNHAGPVEVAAVWNDPHGGAADSVQGGRFYVDLGAGRFRPAKAAPGEGN